MPGLTGLETLIALRKGGRKEYIVGLTGDTSEDTRERFRQAGANECVLFIISHLPIMLNALFCAEYYLSRC